MKPNPLSSLNHFTVPVGMWELLHGMCVLLRGGCFLELRPASACTTFAGLLCRPDSTTVAGRRRPMLSKCCRPEPSIFQTGRSICVEAHECAAGGSPGRLGWADGRARRREERVLTAHRSDVQAPTAAG